MTATQQWQPTQQWENTDIPRDHMDRPLIMTPDGGKRVPYRRCTTFVGALEDRYNLEKWKMRRVAWGMGQRGDLVMAAAAAHIDDKKTLDGTAKEAMEFTASAAKANIGTALHKLTHRMDLGYNLGRIPAPHDKDIKAYAAEMKRHGVKHVAIETFRVFDDWKVAGTADRIVEIDGQYYIADIKTGDIERVHKIVMQLAMYEMSIPYNIGTDVREVDPWPINHDRGLVIYLPQGEARCELHWVDLQRGRVGLQTCFRVFEFRGISRSKLTWPVKDQMEFPITTPGVNLVARVDHMVTMDELRALYFEATTNNLASPDFVAAVHRRKAELATAQQS